jgi:hypothetical protein
MEDIRTSRRFPVHLPLKFFGDHKIPPGSTANISAAGVYLYLEGGLQIDSAIEFEITIPAASIGAEQDARLHCHGRVVRCDTNQELGRTGVACLIERYEFLRADDEGKGE